MEESAFSWRPYDFNGTKRKVGEALRSDVYSCAYCKGTCERPSGAVCPVCKGKGDVFLKPPVVVCAFCKGRGAERRASNVTCTPCRGKGYIAVTEPVEACPACRGAGAQPQNNLPCIRCRGAGVVTVK